MSATLFQYILYLFFKFSIEYGRSGRFVGCSRGTRLRIYDQQVSTTNTILNLASIREPTILSSLCILVEVEVVQ
jgi:hypothetical protein